MCGSDALRDALATVRDVPPERAAAIRGRYSPQSIAAQCLQAYQQLLDEPGPENFQLIAEPLGLARRESRVANAV